MAEIANYYFANDTEHEPIAFCVDGEYVQESNFCNLPVIPFEEVAYKYPQDQFCFHAAIYANQMNKIRKQIYEKIKQLGYNLVSYISSKAYTWNSVIGDNSFILEGCNIQPFTYLGNNNVIWSFSHIGHHSLVGNHNFISSHVVIAGNNRIDDNCFIGTNSTTRDSIHIPSFTFIGQSSSVTKSIDQEGYLWIGSPLRKIKESEKVEL